MKAGMVNEQDRMILRQDWEAVGQHLTASLHEVALELGGEDLARQVAEAGGTDTILPNPIALLMLEETNPGSIEDILSRAEEIQRAAQERELKDARKFSFKKLGNAMLDGFGHLNIFAAS